MKWFIAALLFFSTPDKIHAQKTGHPATRAAYQMPSRDFVMLQFGYDHWNNAPDSLAITGIGRAFNAYLCYDFPILKSNFSFAAGAGIGTSNIYFKNQELLFTDTAAAIRFIPETEAYKKYKLNLAYIEAPFEIRYFSNKDNRNKGIKAAVGLRIGTLLSAHTKGKYTFNNKPIIEKVNTKRYLETWRYAATARIGYGNFSLFGTYALNGVFRVNAGPDQIRPISIGLCISGL